MAALKGIFGLLSSLLGVLWIAFVLLTPFLGAWLGSSLVAFHGGPQELAAGAGVLLFPGLPALWELWATKQWRKKLEKRRQLVGSPKRLFSTLDRLILRTLAINLALLAALMVWFPKSAFSALATRGDWFLGDGQDDTTRTIRGTLFASAAGLEWLHALANPNPYKKEGDDQPAPASVRPTEETKWARGRGDWRLATRTPTPQPTWPHPTWRPQPDEVPSRPTRPTPIPLRPTVPPPTPPPEPGTVPPRPTGPPPTPPPEPGTVPPRPTGPPPTPPPEPGTVPPRPTGPPPTPPPQPGARLVPLVPDPEAESAPTWNVGDTSWPQPNDVHPVVRGMTAADETSIEAVARTIRSREPDPFARVKALHDWVVTRLHYDSDSLLPGRRKAQDAQSVFEARMGVCEGYARLLVALGAASGDKIVYVVGDVREPNGEAASVGHAWNTVEVNGRWYMIDATWDDPVMVGGGDVYRTDYLFIPPSLGILDHFPDDRRWQLLARPLSRGEFLRQPFARPGLAREGLALIAPERSTVEVSDRLELKLLNPRRLHVSVELTSKGALNRTRCGTTNADPVELHCQVAAPGRYQARIFTNTARYGTYDQAASIDVIAR